MPATRRQSNGEQALANALIQRAKVAAQSYEGDYRAPWLLSPTIYCDVWSLRKGNGETRLFDGDVVGDRKFDWCVRLPNGTSLTDKGNQPILQTMQRLAFLARATPGGPETLTTHLNFLWSLTFLVRWMFLREASLQPNLFGFSRLTHNHFCDLIRNLAFGGVSFALQCPQLLIIALYSAALGRNPTVNELEYPLALDEDDCSKVRSWLQKVGYIEKRPRQNQSVSINMGVISEMIGTDIHTLSTPKFAAFLTQFTVGPLERNNAVVRGSADTRRECASHKCKTARDLAAMPVSEKTVGKYVTDLMILVALHRHLPEVSPAPREFRPRELNSLVANLCRPAEATPWVPLRVALDYTRESLRWIHVYGKPLVDVFLRTYAQLFDAGLLAPPPTGGEVEKNRENRAATAARDRVLSLVKLPKVLDPLNINGWQSYVNLKGDLGFYQLRKSPSMLDAIMVLIGSIVLIIGAMKPMRESELRHLRRGCVSFSKGDGYWLSARQGKRSVAETSPELRRPIPSIVAKAILLLRQLTDGLKGIVGVQDKWLLDSLFALPTLSRYEARIEEVVSAPQLNQILDTFCDRVALPPDSMGRRWYIRVHELRKSFLIVFFWTYRYANLEAAAWIAGHMNVGQLYDYLQANFPGQELPALEAEYSSKMLRSQGDASDIGEIDNIELLHKVVCREFGVSEVSWIEEQLLRSWLTSRFASGDFEIRPYSLPVPGGHAEVHIAFRIRESG